jgi:hypothetical protein
MFDVIDYMNVFVVGEAIRELVRVIRVAAVVADTGSPPRFEEQDRASQVPARIIPQRAHSSRDAREASGAFLQLKRHI